MRFFENKYDRKKIQAFLTTLVICSNILSGTKTFACTTILVGKKATADGSVMMGHNEDLGLKTAGRLWWQEAGQFQAESSVEVPYISLPVPETTYSYWASGNARGSNGLGILEEQLPYDDILTGMNQWGVSMSCNWAHSREDSLAEEGIRRYAMRQLILERSKSAFDAVRLVGELIEQYGQADWSGLIYNIADSREAWVLETTTHNWVARRVPDNAIYAVANQFTIEETFDLSSKNLISFAMNKGWFNPKEGTFNFREVYGKPEKINQPYDTDREQRIYELLRPKTGSIEFEDIMTVLRDRYEGTEKFTPPQDTDLNREYVAKHPALARPISVNTCQSSSVAHLRGYLPTEAGAVLWFAMANPGYSGYFPVYSGASRIPDAFSEENSFFSKHSAWWTFKNLQAFNEREYDLSALIAKYFWENNHATLAARKNEAEDKALNFIKQGNIKEASELLGEFTYRQAQTTLQKGQLLQKAMPNQS